MLTFFYFYLHCRIDADTEDIAINISGAQRELLKYFATVSSNRWLMVRVFGIIIVRIFDFYHMF